MTSNLTENDLKTVKKIGIVKMARLFTNLFNSICRNCKRLAQQNTRRPIDDYCDECKPKIKKVLDKLT